RGRDGACRPQPRRGRRADHPGARPRAVLSPALSQHTPTWSLARRNSPKHAHSLSGTAWTRPGTWSTSAPPRPKKRTTARKPLAASSSTRPVRGLTMRRPTSVPPRQRAREERGRAQADEQLRQQYEAYRATRLAELRATTPPDALAAIEEA